MLIFIFLKLLGSLALFLYGVNILNKGARSCFAESYVAVNLWMSRRGRKFHPSHVSFLSKIVEIGATMSLWLLAVLGFGLDVGLYIFPLFILAYPLYHSENVLRVTFGLSSWFARFAPASGHAVGCIQCMGHSALDCRRACFVRIHTFHDPGLGGRPGTLCCRTV